MPTRNVNLTPELDKFVAMKIESGRYDNASEVMRAGLRALERDEQEQESRLAALREAIVAGEASGIAPDGIFGRIQERILQRAKHADRV
jgi:antitoxin ParD1/3/4